MKVAVPLVPGIYKQSWEPVLRVVTAEPGQPQHIVRNGKRAILYVPTPWFGEPTGYAGQVGAAEEIHLWARDVGRSLLTHQWLRQGDTVIDLGLLHRSGLPLERSVRLATLGLIDGLGGPTAAARERVHLTGVAFERGVCEARSRAVIDSRAAQLARELVDARANQITPESLANYAVDVAASSGLSVRLWDAPAMATTGMGGILSVGAGSPNPPVLVELVYQPVHDMPDRCRPVCLVGKGITFDSGGLSMKSAASMIGMHSDKAGAVTVLAVMSVLRDLGVTTPVRGYLALAENLPGPGATRPGDIVTMLDGTRVEVVDTDFEGRVLLADALVLASGAATVLGAPAALSPAAVIDLATLTYQAVTALGPEIGTLIARDQALGRRVLEAADRVGEPLWPLPWAPRYLDQIRSRAPGARLRNHPCTDTGRALSAALFLGAFVPDAVPWVHLDVAGPAMTTAGADGRATGYGVRTLVELLEDWIPLEPSHESAVTARPEPAA